MKKEILGAMVFIVAMLFVWGCGSSSTTASSDDTTDYDLPDGEYAFYSQAQNTTPYILAAEVSESVGAAKAVGDWESGTPSYEVFNLLREYEYPRDEGVIDVSNVYKFLFEASTQYTNALTTVVELTSATPIESPFNFGTPVESFTSASEHAALAISGGTISSLLTWIWDESPKFSYGVIEGSFNDTTGDNELDMAYLVDYASGSDYSVRTWISGNDEVHDFLLKTAKMGTAEGAYAISIIGTGVSRSDDPQAYFLLKIIDNGGLAEFPEGRFFKVTANATEADMMALPATGQALEDVEDPENYAAVLDAMTPFALDGSDSPLSVSDFSNSDLILDVELPVAEEPESEAEAEPESEPESEPEAEPEAE